MRWSEQITLIALKEPNEAERTNEHGFPVEREETATTVFADKKSVGYEDDDGAQVTLTDAEYIALLTARGAEELEQYAETLSFGSKINTAANLVYRTDYDLGDRVTCVNKRWGIRIDVRITEIAETYQNNVEEIDITFGESLPALLTQIRQITK